MAARVSHEHYFHDFDAVEQHVRNAVEIADRLTLTGHDRSTLLPKIVELLAAKQVFFEQAAPLGLSVPPGILGPRQ